MLAILATPTASSDCTLNGQPVPCDQLTDQFGAFFVGFGLVFFFFFALFFVLGVAGLALTIWMIVHAAQNEVKDRALWIVLMALLGPVAAVIYYFAVKRPFDQQRAKPAAPARPARPRRPRQRRRKS